MVPRSHSAPSTATDAVSVASLVAFRIAFGTLMVVVIVRYFVHGWIAQQFLEPSVFFPYPGFQWIRPWPGVGMYLHFAALGALAVAIAVGWRHRLACWLFFLGFTWVHGIDRTNYLNHYYLVSLLALLLSFLPLDRRRAGNTVARWQLQLVRFQVGVVYFFAGIAKLTPDWLGAAQPLRIWLATAAAPGPLEWLFARPEAALVASWCAAGFDLAIPFLLAWRRTHRRAFAAVVLFHCVTAWLFPIGLFPWVMIVAATVFLEPGWAASALGMAQGEPSPRPRKPAPWVVLAVALWIVLQLGLPLRSHLSPGDVHWGEEGFRFSWRVMVMEKHGVIRFRLRDPVSGAERWVAPEEELTVVQRRMMATQPDMILSYGHHLADRVQALGEARPEVHAFSRVSLNGRSGRALVDPTVDLAALAPDARARDFTLPLEATGSMRVTPGRPRLPPR